MSYLYVRDVAEQRRISTSAARAWLAELERTHGTRVVGRAGKRMYTTVAALAKVAPKLDWPSDRSRLEEKLDRMAEAVSEMHESLAILEARLARIENPSPAQTRS